MNEKIKIRGKGPKTKKGVWEMLRRIYLSVVVLAGVLVCAAGTSFANEIDGRIEDSAKNSYVFKNYLRDDSVKVKSEDGLVTLTGKAENQHHKALAEDAVEDLPGVQSVKNEIQVPDNTPSEYSDAWVTAKVKTILLYHRNVSGLKTQVDVKEGVVTLTGEADSMAQKDLTAKYVSDIDGVKSVKNDLKVVEPSKQEDRSLGEKIDDASITAQIKAVLLVHRSTSAVKTKVHTEDGVVTVEGEAKDAAEKDLVTELIRDVRGVKNVNNHMTTK